MKYKYIVEISSHGDVFFFENKLEALIFANDYNIENLESRQRLIDRDGWSENYPYVVATVEEVKC